jgi:hypothetical protein
MNDDTLRSWLIEGGETIQEALQGKLTFREFVGRYDNFYYRCGLDGFDASSELRGLLPSYSSSVEFHRRVQEILNRSYFPDPAADPAAYAAAGRITESEAREEIADLARELDLTALLDELRARSAPPGLEDKDL